MASTVSETLADHFVNLSFDRIPSTLVDDAKRLVERGLRLFRAGQFVDYEAALALAMASDATQARSLAQEINRRFPLDTQAQSLWLPAVRAQLALTVNDSPVL